MSISLVEKELAQSIMDPSSFTKIDIHEEKNKDKTRLMTSFLATSLLSHQKANSLLQNIFSFHETTTAKDLLDLRCSSKFFSKVLRLLDLRDNSCQVFVLQPPPLWISFPSSKYPTLQSLVDRLETNFKKLCNPHDHSPHNKRVEMVQKDPTRNLPIYIKAGEYREPLVNIRFPLTIIGAGREKTTLRFRLRIHATKLNLHATKTNLQQSSQFVPNWNTGTVVIEDLKIKNPSDLDQKPHGLEVMGLGWNTNNEYNKGLDKEVAIIRRCTLENCMDGLRVTDEAYASCEDLQVVGCSENGIIVYPESQLLLSGEDTRIEGNATSRNQAYGNHPSYDAYKKSKGVPDPCYGLHALGSSRKAHFKLVAPLTKEKIAIGNGNVRYDGGNWGGGGTILSFKKDGRIISKCTTQKQTTCCKSYCVEHGEHSAWALFCFLCCGGAIFSITFAIIQASKSVGLSPSPSSDLGSPSPSSVWSPSPSIDSDPLSLIASPFFWIGITILSCCCGFWVWVIYYIENLGR